DLKFQSLQGENLPPPQVIVAAIDEKGVDRFGLWPWRRTVIADFITAATRGGAKVIAFDAVFSDEDRNASYVDVKSFLDTYQEQELSPQTAGVKNLLAQIASLEQAGSDAAQAIASLEKTLKRRGDGKVTPELRRAKQSSE